MLFRFVEFRPNSSPGLRPPSPRGRAWVVQMRTPREGCDRDVMNAKNRTVQGGQCGCRYFCWRKIDIFPDGNSIYRFAIRYDLNPLSPHRAYRAFTHIEGEAYIENPGGFISIILRSPWGSCSASSRSRGTSPAGRARPSSGAARRSWQDRRSRWRCRRGGGRRSHRGR